MTSYSGLRLEPVSALGMNILPTGTVFWNAPHQFFYPVGSHIRHYNLETNHSQFLFNERFSGTSAKTIKICEIQVSQSGQFVGISEVIHQNRGIISIYDFETQVTHVRLENPGTRKWFSLVFSSDSNFIAAISQSKENRIFIWKLGRQIQLSDIIPISNTVTSISFDPQDCQRILVFSPKSVSIIYINTIEKQPSDIPIELEYKENYSFVPSITGLLLVSYQKFLAIIHEKTVQEILQLDSAITSIKTIRHFIYLICQDQIFIYRANQCEPYISLIGEICYDFGPILEFSPSPDGDQAIILHNESHCGVIDLVVAQKIIKQQSEQNISSENRTELSQFLGLYCPLSIRFHNGPVVAIATCPCTLR